MRAVAALALLFASVVYGADDPLRDCRQLILVVAENADMNHGDLATFERANEKWAPMLRAAPVMLGRNGLAWGVGLHAQAATKREGDGRSPAGIFALEKIYGSDAEPPTRAFSYQRLLSTSEGVDDPRSRYYNRIVDGADINHRDWTSSEKLRPTNPMFRWIINVKHNWPQRPGLGSCIYLHIWKAPGVPTSGCTAMSMMSLERIVHWLDASKNPRLVQLTRDDYARLRDDWDLP